MTKQFLLKVRYQYGSATMIVNTPDLTEAIEQLQNRTKGLFGKDKSSIVPHITKAELIPVTIVNSLPNNEDDLNG